MKHLVLLILLLVLSSTVSFAQKAPTDSQLMDLCRNAGMAVDKQPDDSSKYKAFLQEVQKIGKNCDLRLMTAAQVDMLFEMGGVVLEQPLKQWLAPLLDEKASKGDIVDLYYRWKYSPEEIHFNPSDKAISQFRQLVESSRLDNYIKERPGVASEVLDGAVSISGDKWVKAGLLDPVKKLLGMPLPEGAVVGYACKVFNVARAATGIPEADKEELRQLVLKQFRKVEKQTSSNSRKKQAVNDIAYLQGPYAMGKLIGNRAPAMHFKWISGGTEKTLADFKGKVVLLDFWATKCAPCVAAFPEMAKLQEYYKDKPVVILGVTSIMGYFVDMAENRTIDSSNNPEKEMSLMPGYMQKMGITWRIAFTEEDVMNTDYGVLAIPHVTIIDKQGNVRFNNVEGNNADKIKMIDKLLQE